MLKASGAMAVATLSSRVLGMVREMVYAQFMGDTPVAGIFKFAFQIPNLFRRLLGEGALTAAFIPIFKEKEKTHGEIEMWRAANAVISGLIIAASVVIAVVMIGISLALEAHQFSESRELTLRLLRVMFPYMLLVCLAAAMMGMLNARGHFFIPAMGATMLNVVMIASVYFLAPHMGHELSQQVFALAIGVLAAGVAQAAFQMPTLWRDGFRYAKAGIILNELVPQGSGQGNLFHSSPSPKNSAVMHVMDTLNKRMGRGTVYQAAIGIKRDWALRADYHSPRYTSRWEDIPKVRCK
jgi:putative peptidoglycan lipid II flippase